MLFCPNISYASSQDVAQEKMTITGVVKDQMGDQLPGVSIQLKGTTVSAITDINGNFSISAHKGGVLAFSYLGMKPQEVQLIDKTSLIIVMEEDVIV
jgi:hypothetical protein